MLQFDDFVRVNNQAKALISRRIGQEWNIYYIGLKCPIPPGGGAYPGVTIGFSAGKTIFSIKQSPLDCSSEHSKNTGKTSSAEQYLACGNGNFAEGSAVSLETSTDVVIETYLDANSSILFRTSLVIQKLYNLNCLYTIIRLKTE